MTVLSTDSSSFYFRCGRLGVALATVSQVVEWELARSALSTAQPQLKNTTRLLFSSSRVVSVRDTLPAPD
jgi:hypothetical protein